jgi:hypothetical protein
MFSKFGHAVRTSPTDGATFTPFGGPPGVATQPLVMGMFRWTESCCISPQRLKKMAYTVAYRNKKSPARGLFIGDLAEAVESSAKVHRVPCQTM